MRIQKVFSLTPRAWAMVVAAVWVLPAQAVETASSPVSSAAVSTAESAAKVHAAKPMPAKRAPAVTRRGPAQTQATKGHGAKPSVAAKPASAHAASAPAKSGTKPASGGKAVTTGKGHVAAQSKNAGTSAAKTELVSNVMPAVKPADLAPMNTPQDFCAQATHVLPSVSLALCARAQLIPTAGRSLWGRAILQRDVVAPTPQLRVLVIGGIHGDERSSSALVLHWIQQAVQTPMNVHWRFVPLVNPDGMLLNPPRRTNASGVDLNRNFPTPRWDKEAPLYWNNRTKNDPRRYPGPKPLSEPESRWIHDEMERWKPNLIVSVHAPYGILDFDGPTVPPQRLGRLYLDQVGIYPGSLGNFGGIHKRVPVVTIELPNATTMPNEAEIRQMWLDLLRWMGERLGAG